MRIYPQRGIYLEQPTAIEIIGHAPSSRVSGIEPDTPDGASLTQAPSADPVRLARPVLRVPRARPVRPVLRARQVPRARPVLRAHSRPGSIRTDSCRGPSTSPGGSHWPG